MNKEWEAKLENNKRNHEWGMIRDEIIGEGKREPGRGPAREKDERGKRKEKERKPDPTKSGKVASPPCCSCTENTKQDTSTRTFIIYLGTVARQASSTRRQGKRKRRNCWRRDRYREEGREGMAGSEQDEPRVEAACYVTRLPEHAVWEGLAR